MDGIEDAAQIHEWSEHKGGDDGDAVEILRVDAVDEPAECEDETRKEEEEEHDERMGDGGECEEKRDDEHQDSDQHAANDAAPDEAGDDDDRRRGRDQNLINIARKEFRHEECRCNIHE